MTPLDIPVRFEKWEGLGNDFVVLRDLGRALTDVEVQRLCDRRFGIGADGVLLVETTGGGERTRPRMIVRNADGSRPEMCGNGLRCVVGHLAQLALDATLDAAASDAAPSAPSDTAGRRLVIDTDAGPKDCEIVAETDGVLDVAVDMGAARRGADLVAGVAGREHRFLTIDMGNPHAVTFEPYDDAAVDAIGPAVATRTAGGTNVEFCRDEPRDELAGHDGGDPHTPGPAGPAPRIAVTVWERGVGRTLACGTGACAVAAAACDTGRARFGEPIVVALPGGELTITVAPETRAVRMRGPARRVFAGEVVIR